jgi:hypothetical protein
MAESHPFANAGLGMFGQDVGLARAESTPERKVDKDGKPLNPIAMALGALIQQFGSKDQSPAEKAPIDFSAPPPQFEPKSIAPEVNQQQYVNPYQSGGGPNQIWGNQPSQNPVYGGVPMNPQTKLTGGFNQPNPFGSTTTAQPQNAISGYQPLTNQFWGAR